MTTKTRYVPIRMPESLFKQIKKIARQRETDASKVIRCLLHIGLSHIQQEQEKHAPDTDTLQ